MSRLCSYFQRIWAGSSCWRCLRRGVQEARGECCLLSGLLSIQVTAEKLRLCDLSEQHRVEHQYSFVLLLAISALAWNQEISGGIELLKASTFYIQHKTVVFCCRRSEELLDASERVILLKQVSIFLPFVSVEDLGVSNKVLGVGHNHVGFKSLWWLVGHFDSVLQQRNLELGRKIGSEPEPELFPADLLSS